MYCTFKELKDFLSQIVQDRHYTSHKHDQRRKRKKKQIKKKSVKSELQTDKLLRMKTELGLMAQVFNFSTQEAEAYGSL